MKEKHYLWEKYSLHFSGISSQVTLKAIKVLSECQQFVSKAIIEKMLFKDILDHQFDGGSRVFKVLDKNGMPSVTCRSVQHCQQQFNWDCGLSCVLMAFDAADLLDTKDTILANIEDICQKEGFGHSTWSIDLCYLIKHYAPQLRFSYTTTTIGVDPSYMNQVSIKEVISKVVLWACQPAVNPAFFRP